MNYYNVSIETLELLANFKDSPYEIKNEEIGLEGEKYEIKTKLFLLGYEIRFKRFYLFNLVRDDVMGDELSCDNNFRIYRDLGKTPVEELIKKYNQIKKLYEYRFQ